MTRQIRQFGEGMAKSSIFQTQPMVCPHDTQPNCHPEEKEVGNDEYLSPKRFIQGGSRSLLNFACP